MTYDGPEKFIHIVHHPATTEENLTMDRFDFNPEGVKVLGYVHLEDGMRAEHDRQAAAGDVPAPPEVDDTETAPR